MSKKELVDFIYTQKIFSNNPSVTKTVLNTLSLEELEEHNTFIINNEAYKATLSNDEDDEIQLPGTSVSTLNKGVAIQTVIGTYEKSSYKDNHKTDKEGNKMYKDGKADISRSWNHTFSSPLGKITVSHQTILDGIGTNKVTVGFEVVFSIDGLEMINKYSTPLWVAKKEGHPIVMELNPILNELYTMKSNEGVEAALELEKDILEAQLLHNIDRETFLAQKEALKKEKANEILSREKKPSAFMSLFNK